MFTGKTPRPMEAALLLAPPRAPPLAPRPAPGLACGGLPEATELIGTLISAVRGLFPACAPFASSRKATISVVVSGGKLPGESGGIELWMKFTRSCTPREPQLFMKFLPASCGPSRPVRSGAWHEEQFV